MKSAPGDGNNPTRREGKKMASAALNKLRSTADKHNRLAILKSLLDLQSPWTTEVLIGCLDDPYETIGMLVVRELGAREGLDIKLLFPRLSKAPWYVKNRVLKILGIKKNPHSLSQIESILTDPNVEVRRTAALTLGQIGGKEALALLARMTKDTNPFVRKAAEKALQETSDLRFT